MHEWYPDSHWHNHIHPDTEPAFVVRPGQSCCPEPYDDCVCVTEEDVDNWNKISALSSISESSLSGLSALDNIVNSADNWNDNYITVSANSANWNEKIDISDVANNSGLWNSASLTVSSNSSHWEKAYNSIFDIIKNAENISALSSELNKHIKLYFDSTFSGDGSQNNPYTVKYYQEYVNLLNQISANMEHLFVSGKQNWMTLDATDDLNGINPYLQSLFSAVASKDVDQDKSLTKHGELIEWLINNMANKSDVTNWKKISRPKSKKDIEKYNKPNTIYYTV